MAGVVGDLAAIQVGRPRRLGIEGAADPMDRPWESGIVKEPATGPIMLRRINLDGDDQADRVYHGGPDKAVCCYPAAHYPGWRMELGLPDLAFGGFGENFTTGGLVESGVCIGDVWRVGEAVVQVSQPRQPCWKLARRWKIKTLTRRVQESGRTGWYVRVLTEGLVTAGSPIRLVERPHPEWTVAEANRIMHRDRDDLDGAAALAALPALSASWKATLQGRVESGVEPDPAARLEGRGSP
ncbi:MOSC domain-containing protein [Planctomyces sp. SH-PL62]|uniref:MOSC domain-containing protein n=1 Tax=Planctomyces sp. SH-PL62 TaxID=1636152 RepID=UPI00078CC93D|nr:MOSC domain-containing protein [Planctomyces sp. SH-PL62]AMV40703.1 6-N-hydroxylaminopurine resistance protein [Planctomyces sp. SH-PL62]